MSEVLYEDPYYGLIREMSREALESKIIDLFKEKDRLNIIIDKLKEENVELIKGSKWKIDITKAVEEIIEKLNAEGYEAVKRGKWEQSKCTNCKKSVEDLFSGEFYWDDDDLHYCPNCGARMEK